MTQPTHFVLVPFVPIAIVYYNPIEEQPIQAPEQEEELIEEKVNYNDELNKFLKREEEQMKRDYKRKLFKTVLQGEVYGNKR